MQYLKDTRSAVNGLDDRRIYASCISILEHKNRKILEQLEEQKKRLRMQAQGPGTATAGASRFVGQLKAENVNGPLSALFSMVTRNPESYFTVKSLYTFLATSTNVNICKPKTSPV